MTHIAHIKIQHLRNLSDVELDIGPKFNILYGDNGSGKTSFLEAIHYLGLGRSFRTRQNARVIDHNQEQFTLFANLCHDNASLNIGLSRHKSGDSQLKLAGTTTQLNIVADLLPLQLIHPDGHKLLTAGPKHRRQYLDWGVFHVEHSFYQNWQRAQRAITQRNKLLKTGVMSYKDLEIWDKELSSVADQIHQFRSAYLNRLNPIILETFDRMELKIDLEIEYHAGWSTDNILAKVLEKDFMKDKRFGYTSHGPHKADLSLKVNKKPAHEVLSQGQQKMLIYALKLSQSKLLQVQTKKQSIFLIDDLPAELDPHRRNSLTDELSEYSSQIFITGIEQMSLLPFISTENSRVFHVEHGTITPV